MLLGMLEERSVFSKRKKKANPIHGCGDIERNVVSKFDSHPKRFEVRKLSVKLLVADDRKSKGRSCHSLRRLSRR